MGLMEAFGYRRRVRQAVEALKQELTDVITDEEALEALLFMVDAGAILLYGARGRRGIKSTKTHRAKRAERKANAIMEQAFPLIGQDNKDVFRSLIMCHMMLSLDSVTSGRQTAEEAWCRGLAARLMYDLAPSSKVMLKTHHDSNDDHGDKSVCNCSVCVRHHGYVDKAKIRVDNVVYHALGCPVEVWNKDGSKFISWWNKFCRAPLLDHGEDAEWGNAVSVMAQLRLNGEWPEPDEWGELCDAMVKSLRLSEIREKIDGRSTPRRLIDEYLSKHSADDEDKGKQDQELDLATKTLLRAQERLEDIKLKADSGEAATTVSETRTL